MSQTLYILGTCKQSSSSQQGLEPEDYMMVIVVKKKGAGVTDITEMAPPQKKQKHFCGWFNVRDKGEGTTNDNLKVLNPVNKKLLMPLRDKENGGGSGRRKIIKDK